MNKSHYSFVASLVFFYYYYVSVSSEWILTCIVCVCINYYMAKVSLRNLLTVVPIEGLVAAAVE